jgi:hypothetical protein
MKTSIKINLNRVKNTIRTLSDGTRNGLWDRITTWFKSVIQTMFEQKGGQYGRQKWPDISPSLYGRIRRSSSGSTVGRYSAGSHPLQASGQYKNSFQQQTVNKKSYSFGTKHPLAQVIPYGSMRRMDGRTIPRYVLPDMQDRQTVHEIKKIHRNTIKEYLKSKKVG